jgi:hypothetical protein
MLSPERKCDAATAKLGIGAAVVPVRCCAGLPALGALLGWLTLGIVLGFGLAALFLGALAWSAAAMITRRRQRAQGPVGSVERVATLRSPISRLRSSTGPAIAGRVTDWSRLREHTR